MASAPDKDRALRRLLQHCVDSVDDVQSLRDLVARARSQGPRSNDALWATLVERCMTLASPGQVLVSGDASYFVAPDGRRVSLARYVTSRRVLSVIGRHLQISPGRPVSTYEIVEEAWRGENVALLLGADRVYQAIHTLRRLGLESVLRSERGGYYLIPGQVAVGP